MEHIKAEQSNTSRSRAQACADDNLYRSISRIVGMAGRLLETDLSADQRTLAEAIRNSVDALLTIVYDAEDFAPSSTQDEDTKAKLRALVVDDQPIAQRILIGCLGSLGINADSASTAPEALTLLRDAVAKQTPYPLAFIDYRMTGFTGVELGKVIVSNPTLAETKIVLVTSYDRADIGNDDVKQIFAAYVQKPIQASSVREAIETALGRGITEANPGDKR